LVTREQVHWVARLAKLELSAEEEERFSEQLGRILEYVEQLREIDEAVEDTTRVVVFERDPRSDEPRPGLAREEILALAPAHDDETIRVPAVIEGGGDA
jgi:aspartyl-tRNA(Asn)/glutamyl-tRNA(Gln) amidotransferase subunit C